MNVHSIPALRACQRTDGGIPCTLAKNGRGQDIAVIAARDYPSPGDPPRHVIIGGVEWRRIAVSELTMTATYQHPAPSAA